MLSRIRDVSIVVVGIVIILLIYVFKIRKKVVSMERIVTRVNKFYERFPYHRCLSALSAIW